MLQHSNIDRQNSVEVSPAPFTYTSTLDMAGAQIPAGGFLALRVYVTENYLMPFRFHSIRPDGKVMICDARGSIVGYWQTFSETEPDVDYVSSVLLDMQGVLMGHVACTLQTISLIRRVVLSSLETVFLDPKAFVFLPQCHISMLSGYGRSFGVQSQSDDITYHTGDMEIALLGGAASQTQVAVNGGTLTVGLSNKLVTIQKRADESGQNGICNLVVNGQTVSCAGKSIIIKAAAASNLRVVMENNKVVLRGVNNA